MSSRVENAPSARPVPVAWAWGLFALWLGLLVCVLGLEETAFVRAIFDGGWAWAYLLLQGVLHLGALAACVWVLVRGSTRQRLAVALPTLLLVFYGLITIGGPG